jgi:hypothetical protein
VYQNRHCVSEQARIVRTGTHCQNRHALSELALRIRTGTASQNREVKKHEKEQLRKEIEEAEERNRAEREM